ncbi:hypothetical protein CVD25_13530 [Bacillus canaveralius]|uniref:HTH lysR-type domain-containing protein n=1 Tax=Bacillus canaveralius TaxID=1403243 RepID=A0A2N5GQ12_9BACI|nr:LysR family transcriptional regulator [Bacillus canaveralius]PLR84905.1 hypothetical protein CU635_05285 [Bacillus canaveralius]PLR95807.1 hypothetical protein CVD25_13530 [Bacillus canaveralius]
MEFHQLKTFYYVAIYLNFSKAAEKISLSQPAVSRQIEVLESHYKLPLFNRAGRKVELTDAGRRLLQYAEQILLLAEETEKAMHSLNNLEAGEINLGSGTTIGNYLLPSLVVEFQQKYPNIIINLMIDKTDSIIEKLKKGDLDVAIVAKTMSYPEFNYKALLNDEIILIGGSGYENNSNDIKYLKQLSNETFLLRRQGSNTRENTDSFFKEHNFSPNRIIEFDTNEAIKQAIIKGYGIGFLSKHVTKYEVDLKLLEPFQLKDRCKRNFSLIFPKGKFTSPILLIFSSFLKKNIYKL